IPARFHANCVAETAGQLGAPCARAASSRPSARQSQRSQRDRAPGSSQRLNAFGPGPEMNTYALISYFAQPTVFLYLAMGVAIALTWWRRPESRRGLRGVIFFYLALIVVALPATEHVILGALERQNPP